MLNNNLLKTKESGYVALLSTVLIGAVLLLTTVELAASGYATRYMILRSEAKVQSVELAKSCNGSAIAMLMINPSYIGDATSTENSGTCYVYPLLKNYPTTGMLTVTTKAEIGGSITKISVQYNLHELYQGDSTIASESEVFDVDKFKVEVVVWSEIF